MMRQSEPDDRELFKELYRCEYHAVLRFSLKAVRGNLHLAEDLTHDVFVKVWRTYRRTITQMPADRVRGLLIRTAAHCAIDAWNANGRLALVDDYADTDTSLNGKAPTTPSDEFDWKVSDSIVKRFWDVVSRKLTDGEYQVSFLGWVMDMKDAEIADALHTTKATVQTHRRLARKKIKALVNDDRHEIIFTDEAWRGRPQPGQSVEEV